MHYVYLIVIVHEIVEVVIRYSRDDVFKAEQAFVDEMKQRVDNFDRYPSDYIDACIADGYESFGQNNSIQLHWSDN